MKEFYCHPKDKPDQHRNWQIQDSNVTQNVYFDQKPETKDPLSFPLADFVTST